MESIERCQFYAFHSGVGVDARACLDGFIFDVNQCVPCDGNACNKGKLRKPSLQCLL